MSHSGSSFNPAESIVHGAGVWAPGTTVREIEGHFHAENEPKNATPIAHDGGVPNVDFKDRVAGAVSGHHSTGSTGTGSGLTSSQTGTGSGLTGSGSRYDDSNVTGAHTGTGQHDSTHSTSGKPGLMEKAKEAISGDKSHSSTSGSGLATGTSGTSTTGATHGISDTAERHLQNSNNTGATAVGTGAGAGGLAGVAGHGRESGSTGIATQPIGGSTGNSGTGIASQLRNEAGSAGHTGDHVGTGNRTGDISGATHTGERHAGVNTAGATGATTGVTGASTGSHAQGTASPTGGAKKEGFLAKVKHALA